MRYGFYLPTRGPTATRDGILALAREGERLGLHSAMIADHIVFPVESRSTYPYTVAAAVRVRFTSRASRNGLSTSAAGSPIRTPALPSGAMSSNTPADAAAAGVASSMASAALAATMPGFCFILDYLLSSICSMRSAIAASSVGPVPIGDPGPS
jgi:alkanesulfonate monooxygenase SsuD/methylene tetrahydromethanopterin reductase-like flavin-dependent oxidoreductase (luciferase family)